MILSKKYKLHPNARHRILDGKSVVIQQKENEVVGLNLTGTEVMKAILADQAPAEVVSSLAIRYGQSKEILAADITRLVKDLLSSCIIVPVEMVSEEGGVEA